MRFIDEWRRTLACPMTQNYAFAAEARRDAITRGQHQCEPPVIQPQLLVAAGWPIADAPNQDEKPAAPFAHQRDCPIEERIRPASRKTMS